MLHTGQILQEKYRIEKKLNEGGMGSVYLVTHLSLGQTFALKTLSNLSSFAPEQASYAEQFALEAKILASLDHPGLTKVIDLFSDEKTSYLVMEFVDGVTLTKMLEDSVSPLSQEAVRKLAEQAFDILEYLHGLNPPIIVRDIKPDNLMLTSQGRLKLIDFGLAKQFVSGEDTQAIVRGMGTDGYAPMEQYGEGNTDQRSDLFSLGSTLYFALTGEAPPPVWKRTSLQAPLLHPGEKNPSVSEEFWKGLKVLMEVDMNGRPSSVSEARQLLSLGRAGTAELAPQTNLLVVAHGIDYRLASAQEYYPFQPGDWILKVMQAATVVQAREVRVVQTRSACRVQLAIPAHNLPDAGALLDVLTGEREEALLWLRELACGLKMVGEFRDFSLTLDNWRRAWRVENRAGKLEASSVSSQGRAGLFLEVSYIGKGVDRARQAAEELVGLCRRTRLCPYPLYLDDRRLDWERPMQRPLFTGQVREVYLASVNIPSDGQLHHQRSTEPPDSLGEEEALARFAPRDGGVSDSYLDIRAYLEPSLSRMSSLLGFSYLRQPLHLLWYRHGVLCGHQEMEGWHSLEVMAHCDGSYFGADASGLRVTPGEQRFPMQLKPLRQLSSVLPIIKAELEAYRPEKPSAPTSVGKAAGGAVAAPLLLLLLGAAAGPVVFKSALAAGLLQKAAALGGVAGYLHYDREDELLRNACLKAVAAWETQA